jgi:hypothetical protein
MWRGAPDYVAPGCWAVRRLRRFPLNVRTRSVAGATLPIPISPQASQMADVSVWIRDARGGRALCGRVMAKSAR